MGRNSPGASEVSRIIFDHGDPHPRASLHQGGEGREILLPSPPWGRGWLDEAFSSAEARRVRGSRLLSNLMWDTTLGGSGTLPRQRARCPRYEGNCHIRQRRFLHSFDYQGEAQMKTAK